MNLLLKVDQINSKHTIDDHDTYRFIFTWSGAESLLVILKSFDKILINSFLVRPFDLL